MKKKYKTLSFWTSLSGAIVVLLNVIGSGFGFNVNGEIVNQIVMGIAGVLIVLGVVTMPQGNKDEPSKDEPSGDGAGDEAEKDPLDEPSTHNDNDTNNEDEK